jgi:hypothetical protein
MTALMLIEERQKESGDEGSFCSLHGASATGGI